MALGTQLSLFLLVPGSLLLLGVIIILRRNHLATHPELWSPVLPFEVKVRLAKAFLKKDGWKLLEPIPVMNIFVRAQRDGIWLAMMVHSKETLSLSTLMKDCVNKNIGKSLVIGILSNDTLTPNLLDDAHRNGVFIINPGDLKNVSGHIQIASRRQKPDQKLSDDALA